jgi:hypothetical protein
MAAQGENLWYDILVETATLRKRVEATADKLGVDAEEAIQRIGDVECSLRDLVCNAACA